MRIVLSFLTRIPVGHLHVDDYFRSLGRRAPLFPLVGLIVGAVALGVDALAGLFFSVAVRSALALCANVWVTGALHLDGLMDTADGVGSHRSRDRMLAIMRDSRVGAMGVVAGAISLLLRYALLTEMAPGLRWQALLLAPVLGRMGIVLAAGLWPHARQGEGLGSNFAVHVGYKQVGLALGIGVSVAAGLGRLRGAMAWAFAVGGVLLVARSLAAKLGGLTGDTYGAVNEVAEGITLAIFTASAP